MFQGRDESALYSLEASRRRNRKESFRLVQGLYSNATATLHTSSRNFVENALNVLLLLGLYTVAEKSKREWSTTFDRRIGDLLIRLDSYRVQKKSEAASHTGVTVVAKKNPSSSSSGSDSHFATVHVPRSVTSERPCSSFFSLETSVAVLLQAARPSSVLASKETWIWYLKATLASAHRFSTEPSSFSSRTLRTVLGD